MSRWGHPQEFLLGSSRYRTARRSFGSSSRRSERQSIPERENSAKGKPKQEVIQSRFLTSFCLSSRPNGSRTKAVPPLHLRLAKALCEQTDGQTLERFKDHVRQPRRQNQCTKVHVGRRNKYRSILAGLTKPFSSPLAVANWPRKGASETICVQWIRQG